MRRIFAFILGAFTGGLLGSAAALLLTPVSGADMRGEIDHRVKYLRDEIIDAKNQKRAELEDQLKALRAPKG
jgi:gas vesicle protein